MVNKTQTGQWSLNDLAKYLVLCEISSQTKQNTTKQNTTKQEYFNAVLDFQCLLTTFSLNYGLLHAFNRPNYMELNNGMT
jgi:hypothetical protein